MGFADEMAKAFAKKKKHVDDDDIEPGELQSAGIEIPRGDKRIGASFGGGIRQSNMTPAERAKLRKYRGS